MKMPLLILASASPRRSELLHQLGMKFEVIPGNTTEISSRDLSPGELVKINAFRKARSVARKHPDAWVIGLDTLVALDQDIFGKPANMKEAHEMLGRLQGRTHRVITGVCLSCLKERRTTLFAEQTEVTFRPLTGQQISEYHSQVNPLDKAGAYGIQEKGEMIVDSVKGSFTNVVGLPVERLRSELEHWQLKEMAVASAAC